jgi:hypothetical protein
VFTLPGIAEPVVVPDMSVSSSHLSISARSTGAIVKIAVDGLTSVESAKVRLYDAAGRYVDGASLEPGAGEAHLRFKTPGVYFVRVVSSGAAAVAKLVLLGR